MDDGTIIAECTAITEYLDHQTGNTKARAIVHMMQRRVEAGLLDAVGAYFHHATPGLGPDIESYQCADWGNYQRDRAVDGMRYLDGVLASKLFVAGDAFSMADITAFAGLAYADFVELDIPDGCANLKVWRERVAARPSIAG